MGIERSENRNISKDNRFSIFFQRAFNRTGKNKGFPEEAFIDDAKS
jgi:hypothetical protein